MLKNKKQNKTQTPLLPPQLKTTKMEGQIVLQAGVTQSLSHSNYWLC